MHRLATTIGHMEAQTQDVPEYPRPQIVYHQISTLSGSSFGPHYAGDLSIKVMKYTLPPAESQSPCCLGFSWSCTLAVLVRDGIPPPLFDAHVTMEKVRHTLHGSRVCAQQVWSREGNPWSIGALGPCPTSMTDSHPRIVLISPSTALTFGQTVPPYR